jgi:hypothetical protein
MPSRGRTERFARRDDRSRQTQAGAEHSQVFTRMSGIAGRNQAEIGGVGHCRDTVHEEYPGLCGHNVHRAVRDSRAASHRKIRDAQGQVRAAPDN